MYSQSNSYLGGGNSQRPGGPPFGQQNQTYTGFQQNTQGQAPGPMQPQMTGFPMQNPQQMSYQPTGIMSQPTGFQPMQQQPQLNQQSQQLQQPSQPQPMQPMKTGKTSSEIAQSFMGGQPQQSDIPPMPTKGPKIPKMRLSFLSAEDQAKFEQLFKSAVGDGQALDGEKVKELLIRSNLPEFALAMYMCNLRITGKTLPNQLPDRIKNEVSSMVDIISFNVEDTGASKSTNSQPFAQQPPSQPSNSQLLGQLAPQPTGYPPTQGFSQQPQQTGFGGGQQSQQPQQFLSPQAGLQPQATGFPGGLQPQPTGYGAMPLNAQPTGMPGQWGLVNTPASGLPNIEALQRQMMPQQGREAGFTTSGLTGNASVPWAITKDEKKIYDALFKQWDGFGKGHISGDTALEVLGQSGLPKPDLEKIWTLSDPGNRGRLDMDEFAVAMHLIYRKLNGYPIPARLPPELVPPSARNFNASIGTMKNMLAQDAEVRKTTGAFLQPQKTGVSYLKTHSFRGDTSSSSFGRKDGTVFRNNDDEVGYRSSARRRVGGDGRSPARTASPASSTATDELSNDQLRKLIREKQVILDAMDFEDENAVDEEEALDRKDRREAEDLYSRIRRIQSDIDSHPSSALRGVDSSAERRTLKRTLQNLMDRLPQLASNVRRTEREIAETRLELFRLKDAKAHPTAANTIVGTGPGGAVTEADRLKARAKALMQQRSAALTGKSVAGDSDDTETAARRLEQENSNIRRERENNERMIQDVEDGVQSFSKNIEDSLKDSGDDSRTEHERRRWEDALGVEDEVREFIFSLQRESRAAHVRHEETSSRSPAPASERAAASRAPPATSSPAPQTPQQQPATSSPSGDSYASYQTAEDRAAFIKRQAEQRMAERLAALGLKPPASKTAPPSQPVQESRESNERLRKAQEEDAKRDQERQRRLAAEKEPPPAPAPRGVQKKPPPAPPTRGSRGRGSSTSSTKLAEAEQAIKDQQAVQEAQTKKIEDEAIRQEDELAKEREAAQARIKALEEQYQAGKLRKQEEKKRRQEAERLAKEKEAKFAAQRAELEAAREKERELQRQLESMQEESSSDEDEPEKITPAETTPTSSMMLSQSAAPISTPVSPPVLPVAASPLPEAIPEPTIASPIPQVAAPATTPSTSRETTNPFLKKMQAAEAPKPSVQVTSPPPPPKESTNPFQRLAEQQKAAPLQAQRTGGRTRGRQDEDDWSVVESNDSSDDDEEDGERRTGPGAKQLASMLFGTMGPPRPMSATDDKPAIASPPPLPALASPPPAEPTSGETDTSITSPAPMPGAFDPVPDAPPPPPPMPGAAPFDDTPPGAPPAPPPPPPLPPFANVAVPPPPEAAPPPPGPPPPPMPGMPPPPALTAAYEDRPNVGALLGEIQAGRGLKKVRTKESSSAVIGRVL